MTTCQMSIELGAYVLHALEEKEDEEVRRHVADCDLCQDEVGDLSFTASLLALLTPEDLDLLDVEEGPLTVGAAGTDPGPASSEPPTRRPRRRIMLAVAAAFAATLAIPAARLLDHPASVPSATVIRATDPNTHVKAAVTLARADSGTRVHLSLSGAYPQGWCSLVAHSRDGATDTAATWRADAAGTAEVAGTTAIPTSRLSELDVVTDTGRVLVSIPVNHEEP
jgi:hypothetical protein